jgi:glycosyltransferase involved in cell wall biosynthesis
MRILHVVTLVDDRSSYGGPLTVAVNQCAELRRRGHDARIVAGWRGRGSVPSEIEGVPAHLFAVRNLVPRMRFSGLVSLAMVGWLRRNAGTFEVAHLHLARDLVPLSAAMVLHRAGVPYTTQTHGMLAPDPRAQARIIDHFLTLPVLRRAISRFVLTDREKHDLAALLGKRAATVQLPNGVATSAHQPRPAGRPDVLFLARLHPRKRVMDFAQAALSLNKQGIDARFSVIGPDDGELPQLQAFIRSNPELQDSLIYEGALSHDAAVERLGRASIFVLPSVDEPFPMTLLEALAAGVPSICTVSCGVAEQLSGDAAAVVIEPGAQNLSAAIGKLLSNPQHRADLSRAAQTTVQKRFSMHTVGSQLLESYELREEGLPGGK